MSDIIESVKRIWFWFVALPTIALEGMLFIPLFIVMGFLLSSNGSYHGTSSDDFGVGLFFITLGLPFWVAIFRREFISRGTWRGIPALIFGIVAVMFTWGMALFSFWLALTKDIPK